MKIIFTSEQTIQNNQAVNLEHAVEWYLIRSGEKTCYLYIKISKDNYNGTWTSPLLTNEQGRGLMELTHSTSDTSRNIKINVDLVHNIDRDPMD